MERRSTLNFVSVWLLRAAVVLVGMFLSGGTTLSAQTVQIKLVNGRSGLPISGGFVNVWVGNERKNAIPIPANSDGIALLRLTDKDSEVDIHDRNPVLKYNDDLRINVGYVLCHIGGSNYSWLAIKDFSMREVLDHGIVAANMCGKATALPKPGQVILFVRPLSWWEKMKQ
jgi:hypothetical protein